MSFTIAVLNNKLNLRMIYAAYFILFIAIVQLIVSLMNIVFKQRFKEDTGSFSGIVSVLIPARNEEKNISKLLSGLQRQEYRNIEILVFDDQSADETPNIINQFAEHDSRISVCKSNGLPAGWLGKNFACHSLSRLAKGDYLLFLDADVEIHGNIIKESIHFAQKHNVGLLSIFPVQKMYSLGEKMTVPNMTYILLSLLPLVLVRKTKRSSLAAANGQFMLFKRDIYNKILPHQKFKNCKVEDIEIARFYKKNNKKVACLTGLDQVGCRMYENAKVAIEGFSKNVIHFFGNSFLLAFLFWMTTSIGFLLILKSLPINIFIIYVFVILTTRVVVSIVSRQNVVENILFMIPQQLFLGLFIYKAFIYKYFKKEQIWKGRNI